MLLDKRDPTRMAAAGTIMNPSASQGAPKGDAPALSANEIDALRARLSQNWVLPPGTRQEMKIRIRISLRPDGTLSAPPEVTTNGSGGTYEAVRDSTLRAINASQPFNMLRPSTYESWRELDIGFVPADFM
jgi:hypothetical protein